jgi:hypothetical protein
MEANRMWLMLLAQIPQSADQYSSNVREFGFAIGTGIFLIILFGLMLWGYSKWAMGTLNKKIDESVESIQALETKLEHQKEILIQTNQMIKTALQIIVDGKLSGD